MIDALEAVPGGLSYAELAATVYGLYPGRAASPAQLGDVRRAVSKLRRRGLVTTSADDAPHAARGGRPRVVVKLA